MGAGRRALVCTALGLLAQRPAAASEHQYCIVGAGPAGVQLGHFFHHAQRDYVIFERNERAGSFFERYPRHRRLISLNKRFVREGRSAEFALRHDWNSLLDVRAEANRTRPVPKRSKDLFPHADVLAEYVNDFAEEQSGHIQYGTEVRNLRRAESGTGFLVDLYRRGTDSVDANPVRCGEVIMSTGFWRPRGVNMRVDGAEYVEGYEDVPETGETFEGKSVVVLGLGNAALETAQELQKYAAETHVFARSRPLPEGGKGVRFAYQTHYVGDIRAGRTTILDTYLLKSLDTLDFNALEGNTRLAVFPCQGNRRCIWQVQIDDCKDSQCRLNFVKGDQGLDYWLPLAKWAKNSSIETKVKEALAKYSPKGRGKEWKVTRAILQDENDDVSPEEQASLARTRKELGLLEEVFSGDYLELTVSSKLLRSSPGLLDALAPVRARSTSDNLRYPMDHIIRCFGWAMDQSVFNSSLVVNTTHHGKYPQLKPSFESVSVPGLYFAGTLTHGLDFRKSAGGFIHGFRYTARALFRLLEQKNFGNPWPAKVLPLPSRGENASGPHACGHRELSELLISRINEASGPYQMFSSLGDMVLFERKSAEGGGWAARYLEEVPLAHAHEEFKDVPRLVWIFKYGEGFHGPQVLGKNRVGSTSAITAEKSKFLHPQLSFFPAGEVNATMRHWITEDIFTAWDSDDVYSPLSRFVAHAVSAVTGEPVPTDGAAFVPGASEDKACCLAPQAAAEELAEVNA